MILRLVDNLELEDGCARTEEVKPALSFEFAWTVFVLLFFFFLHCLCDGSLEAKEAWTDCTRAFG